MLLLQFTLVAVTVTVTVEVDQNTLFLNMKDSLPSCFINFLLLILLASQNTIDALSSKVSVGATTKQSKRLPETELVNRRKSPALWRDDLVLEPPIFLDRNLVKPEIMSPAGGWPQLKAAVSNGADAVYLGLSAFSARARATNFDVTADLPQAVAYCHQFGVRVYVALNTLVFDHELEELSTLVQLAEQAGVDALIVQDLGVCKLIKEIAPNLPIHSSTQQSITSSDGVDFCKQQHGATRVVLGRELSVDELSMVSAHTDVETEVFVHGALCVSYSGQCFSSEAWGGRSANRGQCAQACRLPYGLIANGELKELEDMTYLLSPQDLCGLDQVPQLIQAGISCLKIEGRLKDEHYVAATTRAYRNAVDQAWKDLTGQDPTKILPSPEEISKEELSQLFSRGQDDVHSGLTPGFLDGTHHQRVVRGRSPRHRGVHVGFVQAGSSYKYGLVISRNNVNGLKLGDGLVVDRGLAQEEELGGPIFDLEELRDGTVLVQFGRETMKKWKSTDDQSKKGMGSRMPLAPEGAHVWKTRDAAVEKKFRRLSEAVPPKRLVRVGVSGSIGSPLKVTITDGKMSSVGATDELMTISDADGLSRESILKAVGTLGNTNWSIQGDVDLGDLDESSWIPISRVKEARRRAVKEWERIHSISSDRPQHKEMLTGTPNKMLGNAGVIVRNKDFPLEVPKLSVLARNMEQVNAVCQLAEDGEPIDEIMVDFLEVDGMRDAVKRIRDAGVKVVIASPRIIKPSESGIWRTLLRLQPDGMLVRSTGLLHRMSTLGGAGASVNVASDQEVEHYVNIPELLGDFSLNAANALTALELLHAGLGRVTASYDLNANSIATMGECMGEYSSKLEVVAHTKMPIFHTEHCVFARFLSKGDSYLDCGHVCTRNNVHLRDQNGDDNLVLADMGCRNTVFAAQAQSGVHSISQWRDAGIGRIRVELVDERPEDAKKIVRGYLGVIDGTAKAAKVWDTLMEVRDSNGRTAGVSFGSFRNNIERRAGEL